MTDLLLTEDEGRFFLSALSARGHIFMNHKYEGDRIELSARMAESVVEMIRLPNYDLKLTTDLAVASETFDEWNDEALKRIRNLRMKHDGEKCAILCNGWSMPDQQRLNRIARTHIAIGTNASACQRNPGDPYTIGRYHVITDPNAFKEYGVRIPHTFDALFTREPEIGRKTVVLRDLPVRRRFSFDIAEGVVCPGVGAAALQVAVYLGFIEIVFVALDLCNEPKTGKLHYYDEPASPLIGFAAQIGFMHRAAKEIEAHGRKIEVINTSLQSAETAWKKKPFDEVFPM